MKVFVLSCFSLRSAQSLCHSGTGGSNRLTYKLPSSFLVAQFSDVHNDRFDTDLMMYLVDDDNPALVAE